MEKAILVMEMPENCIECPMDNYGRCRIKPTVGITVLPQKSRPQLCPLVPMPERKQNACSHGFAAGWNACLDAIEGRKKNGK